jgi:hypothetical protein
LRVILLLSGLFMSAMSNYLEGEVLKHIFRSGTFAKPATLYIGLINTITDGEAGLVTEVSGGAYARVGVASNDANWTAPAAGNGIVSNAVAVTYAKATTPWGLVENFGIWDALSGGNLLFYGPLAEALDIISGVRASFGPGSILISIA